MVVGSQLFAFLEPDIDVSQIPHHSLASDWVRTHKRHLVLTIDIVKRIKFECDLIVALSDSINSKLLDGIMVSLMQR